MYGMMITYNNNLTQHVLPERDREREKRGGKNGREPEHKKRQSYSLTVIVFSYPFPQTM